MLPRLHQSLAPLVPGGSPRGAAGALPRATADGADGDDGSAHPGEDAAGAPRRQHTLEYAKLGRLLKISHNLVATQPKRREIHVIADNLSTHKTQAVRTFLLDHPHVHLHFTPTYSSWLNQVELWFAKIERDLLARGIFTSVADLARKIRRYIRHYNKAPKPIRWNYRNPAHRIGSTSVSTVH